MGKPSRSALVKAKLHKAGFKPERKTLGEKRMWVLNGIPYDSLTQMYIDLVKKKQLKID